MGGSGVFRESQVCKTFIRRFDSDPRLHPNSLTASALQPQSRSRLRGRIRTKAANSGRILDARQTLCQTSCQTRLTRMAP